MRRLPQDGREFDFPAHEPARRAEAIAAMGYRLAAAGPRTRQRLLQRESASPEPEARPQSWLPAGIAGAESAGAWAAEDTALDEPDQMEPGLVRLSTEQRSFPVWQATALLASAICGFCVVLYGQGVHLSRAAHRQASAHAASPLALAQAQPAAAAPPAPAQSAAPAATLAEAAAVPAADPSPSAHPAAQAEAVEQIDLPAIQPAPPAPATAIATLAPEPAMHVAATEPAPAAPQMGPAQVAPWVFATRAPPPVIMSPSMAFREAPRDPPRLLAALPHPAPHRPLLHPVLAVAAASAAARPADPRVHAATRTASLYELPHWIREDSDEPHRVVIMSPPPHNLDAPPAATPAAAEPAPKAAPPPTPHPAPRAPLVYAEAHQPQAQWGWGARPTYAPPPPYPPAYYPPAYGGYYGGWQP